MKVYYFKDELNDDFAGTNIVQKPLPARHRYISKNPFWNFLAFVFYYFIAFPLVFLFQKVVYAERYVNIGVLRKYRKQGFFVYGNHTSGAGDAFTPSQLAFPKKAYLIVSPDAVSIPVVSAIVKMLGGMPLPTEIRKLKNLHDAVVERANKRNCIVIYPEAHIWPYYTKIRPFRDASFKYPAQTGKPVFCFTKTYQPPRLGTLPRCTVYIDGPFFPDPELSVKENQKMLRNKVYDKMCQRSKNNTYKYAAYVNLNESPAPQESEAAPDEASQNAAGA